MFAKHFESILALTLIRIVDLGIHYKFRALAAESGSYAFGHCLLNLVGRVF